MISQLQHKLLALMEAKHGSYGEYIFFRCRTCHKVVTAREIRQEGVCPHCDSNTFNPTNMSVLEELRMIWKAIWLPTLPKNESGEKLTNDQP